MYVQTRGGFSNTGRSARLYLYTPLQLQPMDPEQKSPTRSPFFPPRCSLPTVPVDYRENERNGTESNLITQMDSTGRVSFPLKGFADSNRFGLSPCQTTLPPDRSLKASLSSLRASEFVQMASQSHKPPCPPFNEVLLVGCSRIWLMGYVRLR